MYKGKNMWMGEKFEDLSRQQLYDIIIEFGEEYKRNSENRFHKSIININKIAGFNIFKKNNKLGLK